MQVSPTPPPAPTPPERAVRLCVRCRYYRQRAPVRLFGPDQLVAPGVLKEQSTWEQQERQHAQQEYQAFLARQPLPYEPHSYAWCARYTREEDVKRARQGDEALQRELLAQGAAQLNPVTGELSPLYVLCAWKNPTGECEGYDDNSADRPTG